MTSSLKEKAFLGVLAILACLSIGFYLKYNAKASPQYAVSFDITREEAEAKAQRFLDDQGLRTDGYKRATVFSYGDQENADTYLQREVGVERTGELARDEVDLWHFSSRFFKPSQQEEYSVAFLPNGRLSGFERIVPEDREGASLSREEAESVAEKFVTDTARYRSDEWRVVEQRSENRPHRVDHVFVFEKNGFRAKDATYRMEIDVAGDVVVKYSEFLKVPESWEREWAKERTKNSMAGSVASMAMFVFFMLPMFVLAVKLYKRRALRSTFALWAAAASSIVTLLMFLNAYPSIVYAYDTTQSWLVFTGTAAFFAVLDALTLGTNGISGGLMIFIVLVVGEALYREMFPEKMALEHIVRNGFRSKSLAKALFVGACVGMLDIAFQVAYYLMGQKVGVWSPASVPYDDIMSSVAPWIFPLFIGLSAAISEEGIFRLFGISFLKKHLKHTWLAVLVVSLVFGFVHSDYPQMPWFARGVEIAIPAVLWALVFLRYGFAGSFSVHYTMNALGMALGMLVLKGNTWTLASSILIGLLPLLAAGVLWLLSRRGGGFVSDEERWNNASVTRSLEQETRAKTDSAEKRPANANETEGKTSYKPLSVGVKWLLVFGAVAGICAVVAFRQETMLQADMKYPLTRQEIEIKAVDALVRKGVSASDYRTVVSTESDSLESYAKAYILQKSDFETLKQATVKTSFEGWNVRFFKPLDKEEYAVLLFPDGTVRDIVHTLDEQAEGAKLSPEDALNVATRYLESHGFDASRYVIVTQEAKQKDHRTDYHFVFEEKDVAIGEATYRLSLDLTGDEPSGLNAFVKVPESWERDRDATSLKSMIAWGALVIISLTLIVVCVREFLHQARADAIPFRFAKKIAWILLAIGLLNSLNRLPSFYEGYETSEPLLSFFAQSALGEIFVSVVWWLLTVCIVGFGLALWRQFTGDPSAKKSAQEKRDLCTDAVIAGYTLPFIGYGFTFALKAFLIRHNWIDASIVSSPFTDVSVSLISVFPAWDLVGLVEVQIMIAILFASACLVLYRKFGYRIAAILLFFVGLTLLIALTQETALESVLIIVVDTLAIASTFFAIRFIAKDNLLAYGIYILVDSCLFAGINILMQPSTFFFINGLTIAFAGILPIIVLIYRRRKSSGSSSL